MGMDAYLYKTTKEAHSDYLVRNAKFGEISKEFATFCDDMIKKYGEELVRKEPEEITNTLTSEEMDYIRDYQQKVSELRCTDNNFSSEELAYWRKGWGLHKFICRLSKTTGTGADCEHIVLTKEHIETILAELKRCLDDGFKDVDYDNNPFGKDEYWDKDDVVYTMNVFTDVLNNYNENNVIYYWCWA